MIYHRATDTDVAHGPTGDALLTSSGSRPRCGRTGDGLRRAREAAGVSGRAPGWDAGEYRDNSAPARGRVLQYAESADRLAALLRAHKAREAAGGRDCG